MNRFYLGKPEEDRSEGRHDYFETIQRRVINRNVLHRSDWLWIASISVNGEQVKDCILSI